MNTEQQHALDLLVDLLVRTESGTGVQAPQNGPVVELRYALGMRSVYNSPAVWRAALVSLLSAAQRTSTSEHTSKRAPTDAQLDVVYNIGQALASANDLVGLHVGPQMLDTSVRALRARFNLTFDGHRPSSLEWAGKLLESLDFEDSQQ